MNGPENYEEPMRVLLPVLVIITHVPSRSVGCGKLPCLISFSVDCVAPDAFHEIIWLVDGHISELRKLRRRLSDLRSCSISINGLTGSKNWILDQRP